MKVDIKYYLIPAGILTLVFILVLIFPGSKKQTTNNQNASVAPLPTKIETNQQPRTKNQEQNNKSLPGTYTGVIEEQNIPQSETDMATQKRDLRSKVPFTGPGFMVDFNYETDSFVILLSDANTQGKEEFETWRNQYYPLIPLDRFEFK